MGTAHNITKKAEMMEVTMVNLRANDISSEKRALMKPCGVGIRNKLPMVMKNNNVKKIVIKMKVNSSLERIISLDHGIWLLSENQLFR